MIYGSIIVAALLQISLGSRFQLWGSPIDYPVLFTLLALFWGQWLWGLAGAAVIVLAAFFAPVSPLLVLWIAVIATLGYLLFERWVDRHNIWLAGAVSWILFALYLIVPMVEAHTFSLTWRIGVRLLAGNLLMALPLIVLVHWLYSRKTGDRHGR